jgi:hypothetical protein
VVVQTGLEPASHTLERRAARPLRFCTIDAVKVEKAVVAHTGIEPALTVFETVALPFGEYVSFSDKGTTTHRLGFEPRTTVLETGMLPLHHLRIVWLQRWESNPHILSYELSTLPLGDTAIVGLQGGNRTHG